MKEEIDGRTRIDRSETGCNRHDLPPVERAIALRSRHGGPLWHPIRCGSWHLGGRTWGDLQGDEFNTGHTEVRSVSDSPTRPGWTPSRFQSEPGRDPVVLGSGVRTFSPIPRGFGSGDQLGVLSRSEAVGRRLTVVDPRTKGYLRRMSRTRKQGRTSPTGPAALPGCEAPSRKWVGLPPLQNNRQCLLGFAGCCFFFFGTCFIFHALFGCQVAASTPCFPKPGSVRLVQRVLPRGAGPFEQSLWAF